jgi:Amt family ammonium transporter
MVMWVICEYITKNPRTITGLCNALIIGLVAITPSAGYVSIASAVAIGAIVSFLSYFISIAYNRYKHKVDDSLDVFTCHGLPGFLGGILVGVFASSKINAQVPDGLIYGNFNLLGKQLIVTCLCSAFSFAATYVILIIMSKTIGIRVDEIHEKHGIDAVCGERAYN